MEAKQLISCLQREVGEVLSSEECALLWHRLMRNRVFSVRSYASALVRAYAHCTKERTGVVVLLINLSSQTVFDVEVESSNLAQVQVVKKSSVVHRIKKSVSWIGNRASDEKLSREEYHLTPENGDLRSTMTLLNGQPLQLTETGGVPDLVLYFGNILVIF